MFGIGLPEMILILALALIVVGPDKLPDLARSLAKGLMELKKTAEGLKDAFKEEGNPLDEIKPDLEEAAKSLRQNLLDPSPYDPDQTTDEPGVNPPAENAAKAYQDLMQSNGVTVDPDLKETPPAPQEDSNRTKASIDKVSPAQDDTEIRAPKEQEDQ